MQTPYVSVDPEEELRFLGPFNEPTQATIKLTNLMDEKMLFKVMTTAPKQYTVRPTYGIINVRKTVTIKVTLSPFNPEEQGNQNHKFLILVKPMPPGYEQALFDTLWKAPTTEAVQEKKLKCIFDPNAAYLRESKIRSSLQIIRQSQREDGMSLENEFDKLREENFNLRVQKATIQQAITYERSLPPGIHLPSISGSLDAENTGVTAELQGPLADASLKSVIVMSFILIASGFLIAKTIF